MKRTMILWKWNEQWINSLWKGFVKMKWKEPLLILNMLPFSILPAAYAYHQTLYSLGSANRLITIFLIIKWNSLRRSLILPFVYYLPFRPRYLVWPPYFCDVDDISFIEIGIEVSDLRGPNTLWLHILGSISMRA